jgi:hypothetical protein
MPKQTKIRRYRRKSRLSKRSRGGMPVYRHIDRIGQSAADTFNGVAPYSRLDLKYDSSLYSFFFEVRLAAGTTAYQNLTPAGPVAVRTLGMKVVLISTAEYHYTHIDETGELFNKNTTTVAEFRAECRTQRHIFDAMPGHSLVPGILYSHIHDTHAQSLEFARSMHTIALPNAKTNVGINSIVATLQANHNFRTGYVVMELIENPVSVGVYREQFAAQGNAVAPLFVTNLARWALLKIAHVTGILHADFHLGNIITGNSPENMLFSDSIMVGAVRQRVAIPHTVQVIDWGRRIDINGRPLKANIDALFLAFHAYIDADIDAFRVPAIGVPPPLRVNLALDQRVHVVLREYLQEAQAFPPPPNNHWGIERLKTPANPYGIDSFIICFFESRYRRSQGSITQASFNSVVRSDPSTMGRGV